MTRLTNYMRDELVKKIVNHGFAKREEDILKQKKLFAIDVYNNVYDEETQAKMKTFPEGFFAMDTDFRCQFGSDYTRVCWDERRMVSYKHYSSCAQQFNADHPLSERFMQMNNDVEKYHQEKDQAKNTANAIVYSVNTVEKLVEIWPECNQFLAGIAPIPKPNLPALPIDEINLMLGLPKAQADAEPALKT